MPTERDELQGEEINLGVSMAIGPRFAVRSVIQEHPKWGFWILASVYGIASNFYTANFYSWGLSLSFLSLFLPLLLFSPLFGAGLFYIDAWIVGFTASWFGTPNASLPHLRAAIAWSKVPSFLSLTMWILLSISDYKTVFIHSASNSSAVMIAFISLILSFWSFTVLVQMVKELQGFSLIQSLSNVISSYFISFLVYLSILFLGRYIYISLF